MENRIFEYKMCFQKLCKWILNLAKNAIFGSMKILNKQTLSNNITLKQHRTKTNVSMNSAAIAQSLV